MLEKRERMKNKQKYISYKSYNTKLRNYLRDFFVYQYKDSVADYRYVGFNYLEKDEKGKAVRMSGAFEDALDKNIAPNIFDLDLTRIHNMLKKFTNIVWWREELAHNTNTSLSWNSRYSLENPFFYTYKFCERYEKEPGKFYSFVYAVLLYFQIAQNIKFYRTFSEKDRTVIEEYLKDLTAYLTACGEVSYACEDTDYLEWKDLTEHQKNKYAPKAIAQISKEALRRDIKYLHEKLISNNLVVVYENNKFNICANSEEYIDKKELFLAISNFIKTGNTDEEGEKVCERQLRYNMQDMCDLGLVDKDDSGKSLRYRLSKIFLSDLIKDDDDLLQRFANMISFFSRTHPLGEVGRCILDRIPFKEEQNIFYKHDYPQKALNDYNNIDLLFAIKKGYWCFIKYRNASATDMKYQQFLCLPIRIRESVNDGRQYLLFYHAGYRSISAIRIEFIDEIVICEALDDQLPRILKKCKILANTYNEKVDTDASLIKDFESDKSNAYALIDKTWGTSFSDFKNGNVIHQIELGELHLIVKYGTEEDDEHYIKNRIKRELRNVGEYIEYNGEKPYEYFAEFRARVGYPYEVLQWARSYTSRIVLLEINGKRFDKYDHDIDLIDDAYSSSKLIKHRLKKSNIDKLKLREKYDFDTSKRIKSEDLEMFIVHNNKSVGLFSVFNNMVFDSLGSILWDILKKDKVEKQYIEQRITKFAKNIYNIRSEYGNKLVSNFINSFITEDGNTRYQIVPNVKYKSIKDFIPLTQIERQWLYCVLQNPICLCFLKPSELEELRNKTKDEGIFDINSIQLHDQFRQTIGLISDDSIYSNVRLINEAISNNQRIEIEYNSQYDNITTYHIAPSYIEYSKRNNQIKLYAVSGKKQVRTFSIERILNVTVLSNDYYEPDDVFDIIRERNDKNARKLAVIFTERNNIPDKILTEFSPWKKECNRYGEDQYRLVLYYDSDDTREIVVRLLGYGDSIYVDSDDGEVLKQIKNRVKKQLELNRTRYNFTRYE